MRYFISFLVELWELGWVVAGTNEQLTRAGHDLINQLLVDGEVKDILTRHGGKLALQLVTRRGKPSATGKCVLVSVRGYAADESDVTNWSLEHPWFSTRAWPRTRVGETVRIVNPHTGKLVDDKPAEDKFDE